MDFKLTTPVVFCVFSRLDTTKKVFEQIRKARPEKLYIVADSARDNKLGEKEKVENVRKYIENNIDWPCEVEKNYAPHNMGCGRRISSGLTWVFEQEEKAIILEDDCVPDQTFFRYCQEMLDYYQDNEDIMMISGNNPMSSCYSIEEPYVFSKIPFIWGWATWRRAWKYYDFDIESWPKKRNDPVWKSVFPQSAYWVYTAEFDELHAHQFDTWDYQLMYAGILHNKVNLVPAKSHVFNIGFHEESTHTKNAPKWMVQDVQPVCFPLKHVEKVCWNREFDREYFLRANKHGLIVHIKKKLGLNINKSIFD